MEKEKSSNDLELVEQLHEKRDNILKEVSKIIVGQKNVINQLLITLFSGGHCLLVGVPGLAKTLLIKTFSEILNLNFSRIQFTPDLMPSDITGTDVIEENKNTGTREFRFIKGPIFANIILADEINRTPPKTQSALLEAMQEYKVTAGGASYPLQLPFFVLATQNPIEQEGTYPLPEAQLDRFMFNIYIDYPTSDEEAEIVKLTTSGFDFNLQKAMNGEEILKIKELVYRVPVSDEIIKFAVRIATTSRPPDTESKDKLAEFIKNYVSWGAGPRASQFLILGAKAMAILDGRPTPDKDDVRAVAVPVLRHRIIPNFRAEADGINSLQIIHNILAEVD